MQSYVVRFLRSLSAGGLVLGTLFFAAALTPSLVPRTYLTQGVLAGACFAIGYGLGVGWRWLWRYMELPEPQEGRLRALKLATAATCTLIVLLFLWWAAGWQDSVRAVMGLEPVGTAYPMRLCAIAIAVFLLLVGLGRLFILVFMRISRWLDRYVPVKISRVVGFVLGVLLFWGIADGVLIRQALQSIDASFARFDALLEPSRPQPDDPQKTGSPASLVDWQDMGRAGREFIATGPSAEEIARQTQAEAMQPIRVYVGLGVADSAQERAQVALAEMKRVGAFDRSVLVVITPTGTGWVDPEAMDPVEYLHHGDIASVAQQYSYLNSPLSLLVQPDYGAEAAQALFSAVYGHWTTLPHDARPRLYLYGLSLGALNSEKSADLFEIIGDPIQGALWVGPPFESRIWRQMTDRRNPGSPAWLPLFRDGSFVRFMNQNGEFAPAAAPWGPMRIVYLQYASDAITFFDYRDLYRRPEWMDEPRGPDVSPELRWYPVVTMLQIALDMAVAATTPIGFGHFYAPEDYTSAWIALTSPSGWTPETIESLKHHLAERERR